MLISLYQLSVFPGGPGRPKVGGGHPSEPKDSVSALDLWHETLMSVASTEHERHHEAEAGGMAFNTGSVLPRTLKLWQHLADEDKRMERKHPFPTVMTKRQRKRAARTLLRGFAPTASGATKAE